MTATEEDGKQQVTRFNAADHAHAANVLKEARRRPTVWLGVLPLASFALVNVVLTELSHIDVWARTAVGLSFTVAVSAFMIAWRTHEQLDAATDVILRMSGCE